MDVLYHSPTTETSLSNPFRGHARLSVIARYAENDLSGGRKAEGVRLLALTHRVRRRQATTRRSPDMARATLVVPSLAPNSQPPSQSKCQ